MNSPSATRGRLLILTAAVLWSTSGAFTNFLRQPTALGLDVPHLTTLQIALGRALFAGLVLVPMLRPRDLSFRPITLLEPLLNPVWAYLVAPDKEKPNVYIFLGGALILLGLVYRYWPGRPPAPAPAETPDAVRPG
jgi:hypothetical protein